MRKASIVIIFALLLSGCALLKPLPSPTNLEQRLAMLPRVYEALENPVMIRWNDYKVPYIEAASDRDAAFALGVTHAHLRLAQMEILKRISQARISEMAGPYTTDIDEALRILDYGRASEAILAAMPPETRLWLDAYVEGVNAYKQSLTPQDLPHEYALLGLENETWRAEDSIALGRLFGTDVNWLRLFFLLPFTDRADFQEIFDETVEIGISSTVSFEQARAHSQALDYVAEILQGLSKSGSNSAVISAAKSQHGHGMIASDPHLGFNQPNAWVMVGLKSPSYNVVGMMPPGIPVFGFGRNASLAWGGTNLNGLSSDLVDIGTLPEEDFIEEPQHLKVRFWFDKKITRRISPYGPVISDAEIIPNPTGRRLALRWAGHRVSDEISALLGMMKARNGDEFLQASEDFSVPGQNFLYVDNNGAIGHVLATHLPRHELSRREVFFVTPERSDKAWQTILKASDLPHIIGKDDGYLASANNKPTQPADYDIGIFFGLDQRIRRLHQLLGHDDKISFDYLKSVQMDVVSLMALELIEVIAPMDTSDFTAEAKSAFESLVNWDGAFDADAREPVLFMGFIESLKPAVAEANGDEERFSGNRGDFRLIHYLIRHLKNLPLERLRALFGDDIGMALSHAENAAEGKIWGDIHRLNLAYLASNAPLIGKRYRIGEYGVSGSTRTLMKTAHSITTEKHNSRYGAQSRHISDMGDLDANYFVLVGGNDGWLNSAHANDQTGLWLKGEYVRLPLRRQSIQQDFPYQTILQAK